ncbi:N,N-dimethylformamidase beta subunit family domain-containing protein [Yinghuangia sp. YIM S09857]|uniref:N,N-dimethylformamidase beta subunit family domain-containing protein n=1 Tax=Yinghuangia sp. YIM S09857 TaxID=3436929 RepID=UPI003F5342E1
MPLVNRRGALGALGAVGATAAGLLWWRSGSDAGKSGAAGGAQPTGTGAPKAHPVPAASAPPIDAAPVTRRPVPPADARRIGVENARPGTTAWKPGRNGTRLGNDVEHQIKGYTSATSVGLGGKIDFHVAVNPGGAYSIGVYRLGDYGGAGARHVVSSPRLTGVPGQPPKLDADGGMLSCDWPVGWTLEVPGDWTSGAYLAVFDDERGNRNYTAFVVRDDGRSSDFLVVLPFSTYQAYNQYPLDGRTGKSLYYGYGADGKNAYQARARKVSFDRPFMGDGMPPTRFDLDQSAITWMERSGYDVTYASTIDIETRRVDPTWYRALVFPGHDEYWSTPMREVVEEAHREGVNQAWLTANNMYWHVRFDKNERGVPDRVMHCWREDRDPGATLQSAPTDTWRRIRRPEQEFLGIQYNGIVAAPTPLRVTSAGHWLWAGTGVRDGDSIDKVVGGEADGIEPGMGKPAGARQVLLAESPYVLRSGARRTQNTSICESDNGVLMFCAGTFNWSLALHHPKYRDERIQRATHNLFERLRRGGRA